MEVPAPSWADLGYLSAIPLTVAALVVHPATKGSGTRKARSVFDGLVIATALLFLSWTLVLGPLWRSANPVSYTHLTRDQSRQRRGSIIDPQRHPGTADTQPDAHPAHAGHEDDHS